MVRSKRKDGKKSRKIARLFYPPRRSTSLIDSRPFRRRGTTMLWHTFQLSWWRGCAYHFWHISDVDRSFSKLGTFFPPVPLCFAVLSCRSTISLLLRRTLGLLGSEERESNYAFKEVREIDLFLVTIIITVFLDTFLKLPRYWLPSRRSVNGS